MLPPLRSSSDASIIAMAKQIARRAKMKTFIFNPDDEKMIWTSLIV